MADNDTSNQREQNQLGDNHKNQADTERHVHQLKDDRGGQPAEHHHIADGQPDPPGAAIASARPDPPSAGLARPGDEHTHGGNDKAQLGGNHSSILVAAASPTKPIPAYPVERLPARVITSR